jgi:hypothetical protein
MLGHADPDPCKALKSRKVDYLHENILKVGIGNRSKKNLQITKAFWKGRKPLFFYLVNLNTPGSGSAFPIRIRI